MDDLRGGRFDGAASRGGWDWATPIDLEAQAQAQAQAQGRGGGAAAAEEPRCGEWAGAGECERNPAFMHSSCRAP